MEKLQVLLLAAGYGTRLKTLTAKKPKPLVTVEEKELILSPLWHLKKAGIGSVTVNLHYKGALIEAFLGSGERFGMNISYSREDPILGTGGAIKRVMSENPKKDILVYNSDAVFGKDFDLSNFIKCFYSLSPQNPIALMCLKPSDTSFLRDTVGAEKKGGSLRITSIHSYSANSTSEKRYIFTGVHIISASAWSYMKSLPDIFSSTRDLYPLMLARGETVAGFEYGGFWVDCGTEEGMRKASEAKKRGDVLFL